jgi:hypothetical protein
MSAHLGQTLRSLFVVLETCRLSALCSPCSHKLFVVGERDQLAGHAFVSYVREDSHRVDQLQRALEAAGISVWRDTGDLWPGEDWRAKIRLAITGNALVFVACFSQSSLARERSYQNEELILAIDQLRQRRPDKPWFIPVRFDDCNIPDLDIGGGPLSRPSSAPTCSGTI